jgi:hypothetical protein
MPTESEILKNAEEKIRQFDDNGLHYNLVADQIYRKRCSGNIDPFGPDFLQYIIAGLISFDIRGMGKFPYRTEGDFFGLRLKTKLNNIRYLLEEIMNFGLVQIDLQTNRNRITEAYEHLAANEEGALHQEQNDHFYVGASKILHFLNPNLFIIIDSNASRAYKLAHGVNFVNSSQPGYSPEKYKECMECAKNDKGFEQTDQT